MTCRRENLLKLLNVEGLVTLKTLLTENADDIASKNGGQITLDLISLIDQMNEFMTNGDPENMLACIKAMMLRVQAMDDIATYILDNMKRNGLL